MWLMAEHMGLLGETHVYDLLRAIITARSLRLRVFYY
jgi:hypothetical protein